MNQQPREQALGELLEHRQKLILMFSLMLCMFVSALDQTMVATATPRILADLGGFSQVSWVFTVYILSSTVVVPIVGKLSDMFGRKHFLIGGIIIFVSASIVAGASQSMLMLILARGVQGAGGGMIFSCVFATLGDLFSPAERGKYIGFFTGTFSLAAISGPTIGGILTDTIGWRWCFYVNVPISILAILVISRNLPLTRKPGLISRIDFVGAALLSTMTVGLLLALVWGQKTFGWQSPETIGLFALAGLAAVGFVFQESRHPEPIFPLQLFKNRVFVQANLIVMISGAGVFGAVVYLPTYLQTALGASATESGFLGTPQALGLLTASIIGGQVLARTGKFKFQVILGSVLVITATLLLSQVESNEAKRNIMFFMLIFGLGSGMIGPTMSVITQSAVEHKYMGVATSGRQFFMQIGQVLGTAIFGVVLATSYANSFSDHLSAEARAELPAEVRDKFDDPTLALQKTNFDEVRSAVLALPNGQAVLDSALDAQREGVTTAISHIFLLAAAAGTVMLLLALTIPEIPLRRGFGSTPPVAVPTKETVPAPAREVVAERP